MENLMIDDETRTEINNLHEQVTELSNRIAEIDGKTSMDLIGPIINEKVILNKSEFNTIKEVLNLLLDPYQDKLNIASHLLKTVITEIEKREKIEL